jgi:hypothetical protein
MGCFREQGLLLPRPALPASSDAIVLQKHLLYLISIIMRGIQICAAFKIILMTGTHESEWED